MRRICCDAAKINSPRTQKYRPATGQTILRWESTVPTPDRAFSKKNASSRHGTDHSPKKKYRPVAGQSICGWECIVPSWDGTSPKKVSYHPVAGRSWSAKGEVSSRDGTKPRKIETKPTKLKNNTYERVEVLLNREVVLSFYNIAPTKLRFYQKKYSYHNIAPDGAFISCFFVL